MRLSCAFFITPCQQIGDSISFRLRGTKSNRDAIGTAITVETGGLRQTKFLQAGTGFLAQHSKELFFGLGTHRSQMHATIQWPSGLVQHFDDLASNHRIQLEEGANHFVAEPFASPPAGYARSGPPPAAEVLPQAVGTWLIEPLKAPEFELPDAAESLHALKTWQGKSVFLNFCSVANEECLRQLRLLHQSMPTLDAASLMPLALFVDSDHDLSSARALAEKERFAFPVLFATAQVAGIYNLIYRHLFDRRRDLPLPTSFLLDRDGMIVKVYQGPVAADQVAIDAQVHSFNRGRTHAQGSSFSGEV